MRAQQHRSGDPAEAPSSSTPAPGQSVTADERTEVEVFNRLVEEGQSERLLEIFEHHLADEVGRRTWDGIYKSLRLLMSYPLLSTVAWAAQARLGTADEALLSEGMTPAAKDLVKHIVMLHGAKVVDALYASPTVIHDGDDWRSVLPEVRVSPVTGRYSISVEIIKKNLDTFVVRGEPRSMIRWAQIMLTALGEIGDPSAFAVSDRTKLVETMDEVRGMLDAEVSDPPLEEEGADSEEPVANAPAPDRED